jgi:hypothetical protein
MSRIDHILNMSFPDEVIDTVGLASAYCFCLTPSQVCVLLQRCVASRSDLRDAALKSVCADIEDSFDGCHIQLLEDLLSLFSVADSRGRQSLGYCLSMIATRAPEAERRTIQEFFLASKYVGIRKRGYKCVSADSVLPQELVRKAWEQFEDPECAWVIVKAFPPEFLVRHRSALVASFTEGWQYARLYLRIAEIKPNLLVELKDIDEISYCYVVAKLDKKIALKEVMKIIDSNSGDERFGLLVWSLGRLQIWEALRHIESQLPAIQEQRLANLN